jgi:hypothetical protein
MSKTKEWLLVGTILLAVASRRGEVAEAAQVAQVAEAVEAELVLAPMVVAAAGSELAHNPVRLNLSSGTRSASPRAFAIVD